MTKGQRNTWYVLYNANDEYIAGFKSMGDLSVFLGNTESSVSSVIWFSQENKNNEIIRTYNSEENLYECSQKILTYTNTLKSSNGEFLGKYCSLYKFWEEN